MPLSAIEGVTAQQTDALAEHGINDIDALAQTSVDDLVEFLDLSLDEAEQILNAAIAVVALRDKALHSDAEGAIDSDTATTESAVEEIAPATVEIDETVEAGQAEVDPTAEGYDEAVETGLPYRAEPEILAKESADPVAITEAEPFTEDEILLQEPGAICGPIPLYRPRILRLPSCRL